VITWGTDGTGRGLARIHLERGDRVVAVGTDCAKADPSTSLLRFGPELIDENGQPIDRLSAESDTVDVLVPDATFTPSRRTETTGGLGPNCALTRLSRFPLSRGLAAPLGRAADPVVLNLADRHPAIRYVKNSTGAVATSSHADGTRLHRCTREVHAR
jgi:NAD(P)-dependent dehydrogenase (short-subunit alcohol dehydrogenase family)